MIASLTKKEIETIIYCMDDVDRDFSETETEIWNKLKKIVGIKEA